MKDSIISEYKLNHNRLLVKTALNAISYKVSDRMVDRLGWCMFAAVNGDKFKAVPDSHFHKSQSNPNIDMGVVFLSDKDYAEMKTLEIINDEGDYLSLDKTFVDIITELKGIYAN